MSSMQVLLQGFCRGTVFSIARGTSFLLSRALRVDRPVGSFFLQFFLNSLYTPL